MLEREEVGESEELQYINLKKIPKKNGWRVKVKVQQLIMSNITGSANSGIQSKYQLANVNEQC